MNYFYVSLNQVWLVQCIYIIRINMYRSQAKISSYRIGGTRSNAALGISVSCDIPPPPLTTVTQRNRTKSLQSGSTVYKMVKISKIELEWNQPPSEWVSKMLHYLNRSSGQPFSPRKQRRQFALPSVFFLILWSSGIEFHTRIRRVVSRIPGGGNTPQTFFIKYLCSFIHPSVKN